MQTSVQKSQTLRIGSCKIEAGADVGSLINLGVTEGNTSLKESWEEIIRMSANGGELGRGIKNHRAAITAILKEINLANLNTLRGGIDTYATQTASAQNVTDEPVVLTGTGFKRLKYKQAAANTECTTIVVKHASGTPTYARNTDYIVAVDPDGYTCLARKDTGSTITTGQTVLVSYTYTPAANVTLSTGGKVTISPNVIRLTNTDAAGKRFMVTVHKAYNKEGVGLDFLPDDNGDYMGSPISLEGICDTAKAVGAQLFEILDEQGV